jgi:hypothetical protein
MYLTSRHVSRAREYEYLHCSCNATADRIVQVNPTTSPVSSEDPQVLHLNSNNAGDTIKVVLSYRRAARSLDSKSAQVIDQEYLAILEVIMVKIIIETE